LIYKNPVKTGINSLKSLNISCLQEIAVKNYIFKVSSDVSQSKFAGKANRGKYQHQAQKI